MSVPLADKVRPTKLDEICGQRHLFAPGAPLRSIIESGSIPNLIFYGPPGTGKTTVARIIASQTKKRLHILNGTSATLEDVRSVISEVNTLAAPDGVLLYLDEIQYFNKKQQQSLLQYIENGDITLIASTTENPAFYIYPAVLSRSAVFEFKQISPVDALPGIGRAFMALGKENSVIYVPEGSSARMIAEAAGGDMRKACGITELCCLACAASEKDGVIAVTEETVQKVCAFGGAHYDKNGDEYYDLLSAFQKSMRGSDANAAVYYLARILSAGDLPSACRRLLACASEDVGLAYPMIIPIVKSAVDTALQLGLPEARLPLADAVILVANSPKSNSGHDAINAAMADVAAGKVYPIPRQLQNKHYDGEDAQTKGQHYLYPHDFPNHWVRQQYLPDELRNTVYYIPGDNKNEKSAEEYAKTIKKGK